MKPDLTVVIELTEWGDNDWEGEVTTNGINMVEKTPINRFEREHFPNDWDYDDFAFLAKFLDEELDVELTAGVMEEDWDYTIWLKED